MQLLHHDRSFWWSVGRCRALPVQLTQPRTRHAEPSVLACHVQRHRRALWCLFGWYETEDIWLHSMCRGKDDDFSLHANAHILMCLYIFPDIRCW